MAATPPSQITRTPETPLTPLHGAVYDHEDSPRRSSARLRQKRALEEDAAPLPPAHPTRPVKTPNTPRKSGRALHSPDQTPPQKSTARRVQIMSPTSPDSDTSAPKPIGRSMSRHQPFLSTTTTLNEGMLPTPVKTPNKKQKIINKSNIAARALFQDQPAHAEMAPSPRTNRKGKRYNGFSLESFRAEDTGSRKGVQIFTDSRDQIPENDKHEGNPFIDPEMQTVSSRKVPGTSKRRRISESRKMDPQVEEALEKDDGMVYVFRGKKVYRRFDDTGEEEEEIDADDLGLLEYTSHGSEVIRPLKTLTRKSIKPTRLFQTEEQKRARELEKEEEAAATDLDEAEHKDVNGESSLEVGDKSLKRKARSTRKDRGDNNNVKDSSDGKKGSPFDSWPRVKPGSASSASASRPSRGRKRGASESFEEQPLTIST